tara:strand:- start:239 stop:526 length:288 start_codon:yes stop_codon:yes gene_type:complete
MSVNVNVVVRIVYAGIAAVAYPICVGVIPTTITGIPYAVCVGICLILVDHARTVVVTTIDRSIGTGCIPHNPREVSVVEPTIAIVVVAVAHAAHI